MTFSASSNGALLLAPFSQEAEESVIGSVIISASVYPTLSAFLKAEDFYLTRHREMWTAFDRLASRNEIMDLTTISEELRRMGKLEDIGGYAYLIHLIGNTPNSMHAEAYGRLVERTSTRRLLLIHSDYTRNLAMDENTEVPDILQKAASSILSLSTRHIEQRGDWLREGIEEHYSDFERRLTLPDDEPESLLFTGFEDLDVLLGALEPNRLIVMAGRPGMGKTAKLLNIVYRMAKRDIPCAFNTMEMSKRQIIDRLLAMDSEVSSTLQKRAKSLNREEQRKIMAAYGRLAELKIFIDDAPRPSPREIMSKSEWLVRQHGVQMIGVDGIYLMKSDYNFNGNKVEEVGQISRGLKEIATTLSVPVIATHQLNRNLEERGDKRPILSDLRSSGEVEQNADTVIFLYRDWVYDNAADPHKTEVIVAKNRDGQTGMVIEHFESSLTKFSDADVSKWPLNR